MAADLGVHIRYPNDDRPEAEDWLSDAAARHGSELSDVVFASSPGQRFEEFPTAEQATSFAAELTATGRWTAHGIGGCGICAKSG